MTCVIKLGGSLLETAALPACLAAIANRAGPIVIVPGGGPFAEQVRIAQRRWHFDDVAAHRMAILAMQQMALLMHSLMPEFAIVVDADSLCSAWQVKPVLIWSPQVEQLDKAEIVASWDITSDSLAAWLAGYIEADELIVVKSAPISEQASLPDLQRQGILDAAFQRFTTQVNYKIKVINKDRFLSHHD
ncbi:uridylate kinase [Methylomonas methanica]|uniref:Uridylate kinase n=1 Tax=Methylomonas methanica TaxID=421 RepID=A0A177MHD5_METMH|nr:uridylate kinase [Methylomonas methanica]OAI04745.1 uridylate kinase [Methylomonas methanica]